MVVQQCNVSDELTRLINDHLVLVYTGERTTERHIKRAYKDNLQSGAKADALLNIEQLAIDGVKLIQSKSDAVTKFDDLCLLLQEAWNLKRSLDRSISMSK